MRIRQQNKIRRRGECQIRQAQVFQGACAAFFQHKVFALLGGIGCQPAVVESYAEHTPYRLVNGTHPRGVGVVEGFEQLGFGGKGQHQRGKSGVGGTVIQHPCKTGNQRGCHAIRPFALIQPHHFVQREFLPCFPAVKGVAVVRQQKGQLVVGVGIVQPHRRRKSPQQRWQRTLVEVDKGKGLLGFGHRQHPRRGAGGGFPRQGDGESLTRLAQKAQCQRNMQRQLIGLPQRIGGALAYGQRSGMPRLKPRQRGGQLGRAGLGIPAGKLAEVDLVGIGHRGNKIIAGDGLAIMAAEVQLHAFAETLCPHQGVHHPHHFRPFFVHRHGVEIVHFDIRLGAHGVGGGACVFWKLQSPQLAHILNPLDRMALHVGRKSLVAEHGQPFFEAELKPVAAGDAVAGPVVEILVGNDGFDPFKVDVGGGIAAGQHKLGVEDIQPFVFHRPHVEVAHRHNHVGVEVVFQPKGVFVPLHGFFQRQHGVVHFIEVLGADVNRQCHMFAAVGDVLIGLRHQLARHEGKQIRRFAVGVHPLDPVSFAVFGQPCPHLVAVRQQHGILLAVGNQGGGELGHDVGAVKVIGDFAEAFGLALGVEIAAGRIQPHQRGIGRRV